MKAVLQLVIMAALVAGFSGNAEKRCVTKKNEHGEMVTVCDGKVMHHSKKGHVEGKRHCVTKKNEHGVRVTVCDGKVVKHHGKKAHQIEGKKHCVSKINAEGKKITTCKTIRKSH